MSIRSIQRAAARRNRVRPPPARRVPAQANMVRQVRVLTEEERQLPVAERALILSENYTELAEKLIPMPGRRNQ